MNTVWGRALDKYQYKNQVPKRFLTLLGRILVGSVLGLIGHGLAQVNVTATTGFIGDMVQNVGGGRIRLAVIAPANTDPHSFEPKPSTLRAVGKTQVLFANGLGLEPFLNKVQAQAPKNAPVVLLGKNQPNLIHTEGTPDPHLWLDPAYGIRYVKLIRDALVQIDPAGKAVYETNAQKYVLEIQKADQAVQACLRNTPPQKRTLVAQHEALAYFARHYQLQVVGAIADFAGQEKGPKSFVKLAIAMKQKQVKALFAEPQYHQAEARALAEATGAKVERIYSDAFDDRVNTYLKLLSSNGQAICEAFR